MSKYLLLVFFGIILYLLCNSINGFSIGVKNVDDICDPSYNDCNIEGGTCAGQCNCINYRCVSENVDSDDFTEFIYSEHRYACASQVAPSLIDPGDPFVDLTRVVEDQDMWRTHGDQGVVFDGPPLTNIPGYLKYVHDDGTEIKLNRVSVIDRGTYSIVYRYSSSIKSTIPEHNGHFISVAVKQFIESSAIQFPHGQDDPEIRTVTLLNNILDYNCKTVQSKIIYLYQEYGWTVRKQVVLMEIMDGTLEDLMELVPEGWDEIRKFRFYKNTLIKLADIYKCLLDLGYYYNDSKLQNVLYKTDNDKKNHIVLGDLGSIDTTEAACNKSTYPPPEYMYRRHLDVTYQPLDHAVKYVVWGFGVIILLILGVHDKWFYHSYNYPNNSTSSRYQDVPKPTIDDYFTNLTGVVIPGLNITDPKIMEIVERIFVPSADRNIDFDDILDLLTDCERGTHFSETGLNPCEPCEICNENQNETQSCTPRTNRICSHKQCNRRDFCNNRGDTSEPLRPGEQYPNCQPCTNCDEDWGGDRCDVYNIVCEKYRDPTKCINKGCEWNDYDGCY